MGERTCRTVGANSLTRSPHSLFASISELHTCCRQPFVSCICRTLRCTVSNQNTPSCLANHLLQHEYSQFSGCLPHHGKTKVQADQMQATYMAGYTETSPSTANLIGQFAFLFFVMVQPTYN